MFGLEEESSTRGALGVVGRRFSASHELSPGRRGKLILLASESAGVSIRLPERLGLLLFDLVRLTKEHHGGRVSEE